MGGEFVLSPDYIAWRRDNRAFQQLAAVGALFSGTIMGGPEPMAASAARVSANFLETFGIQLEAGRTFRPEEELPNGPKAVLLTYPFWRDHFHARHAVVGSAIDFDGQSYTIVGVLPQSFAFPFDYKVDLLTTVPA